MAVAASPLGGLGGSEPPLPTFLLPSCLIYPSQPVSLLQRSNGCSPLSLLPCAPPARCCLPVRSIVTVLSSLTACRSVRPSAGPSSVYPMGRWARAARARARVHCAASHHRVKGSIFPPSILDVMGRKAGGAGDSRTGGQGMHVCIGDECRAEREREGAREGGPLSALASHFLALPACCLHLVRPAGERCIGTSASKCPFGLHCPSIKSFARARRGTRERRQVRALSWFVHLKSILSPTTVFEVESSSDLISWPQSAPRRRSKVIIQANDELRFYRHRRPLLLPSRTGRASATRRATGVSSSVRPFLFFLP